MKYCLVLLLFLLEINCVIAQCESAENYWIESWVSCVSKENPNPNRSDSHWLLFEFDELVVLNETHIWNANRPGETALGPKQVAFDFVDENGDWKHLADVEFPEASGAGDYAGFQGPSFGHVKVKKVLITVIETDAFSDDCVSIAELQFFLGDEALNTGLEFSSVSEQNELEVYPNPFVESIQVTIPEEVQGSFQTELYDVYGRLIALQEWQTDGVSQELNWEGHRLPKGVYLLSLRFGASVRSVKLVRE